MSVTAERDRRVTDSLQERSLRQDRSPVEIIVDRIWRFLCSVRAAFYEIIFLAFLILMGTLKGSIIPAQIPRYLPFTDPIIRRWYRFDVFHSLIFSLTLALLAIAIVVCTINRVPGIWKAIAHPTIETTRGAFERADFAAVISIAEQPSQAVEDIRALLKSRRYRVLTQSLGDDIHVYADKNRFGRLGTFPFHLALILILVGGIVGATYGFREKVFTIPEGSTRDVGHGTGLRVQLERFVDTYNEIGAPTSFRSDLVLFDGEREVKRQSITVNHPMTYGNATFYQAAFGPAAVIRATDSAGNVLFEDGVEFTYASRSNSTAPAAIVELPVENMRFELIFPNTKLDNAPEIGTTKLLPGQLYVQPRDWRTNEKIGEGAVINQGETISANGILLQFVRERRFTVLQVAYNPGIPILFGAAFLVVFGLVITFGLPHRRVRLLMCRSAGKTELFLAPIARRDWAGKRDFVKTLAQIERQFGVAQPFGRLADVIN